MSDPRLTGRYSLVDRLLVVKTCLILIYEMCLILLSFLLCSCITGKTCQCVRDYVRHNHASVKFLTNLLY